MKKALIIILKMLRIPFRILSIVGGILATPDLLNYDLIDHLEYVPGEPRK